MKQFLFAVFMLMAVSSLQAADAAVKIAVGMDPQEAIALLKKHGAEDITPHLAIVGPKGEHPLTGIVWELHEYGAIIEVDARDSKVSRLIYGTTKDFDLGKDHRARTEQKVKSFTLDLKSRTVSLEK